MGSSSLQYNVTGQGNVAIGFEALKGVSGNSNVLNVAVGYQAGKGITTGTTNTFVGCNAGDATTTGTNNTTLGYLADSSGATASNEVTLGNSSISAIRCQVQTISSLSDARDKTDVVPLADGLDFVDLLKPVSFNWNMRDGGKVGIPETGFIAQDLQKVQIDTGITIPGLVSDGNPDRLEAAYGALIPILVQSIKELSAKVTELEAQINS